MGPQDVLDQLPEATPTLAPEVVPADSPLSVNMREAIVWASQHGVLEMTLPSGHHFILKPIAPLPPPTMADVRETYGKRAPLTPGGFEADVLFAASPRPYVPDAAEPLEKPKEGK